MAVYRGHVLLACGDIDREIELHSVRKSLVSALYGTAVAGGEIDLDATLADLGIDDDGGLTRVERSATVRDIIAARSGVYLPAAYAPSGQDAERPDRGAYAPERRIAGPIGMEDWTPDDGFVVYEPGASRHPAHTFRMSARDLARFGLLYLRNGRWDGRQLFPAACVRESTRPASDFGDGRGYGYMWWTYAAGSVSPEAYPAMARYDSYMGRGTGGQAVWVVPEAELVIVNRVDTDHGRNVGGRDGWTMADRIVAARVGEASADPALEPVTPTPLAGQLPVYEWPEPVTVAEGTLDEYMGEYPISGCSAIGATRTSMCPARAMRC